VNRFEAAALAQAARDGVRDGKVLVACSGGGDSMALLALLWAIRRSLGLELQVAHAHHGLRPEAEEEAALVRRLCRNADLDLLEARLDVRAHAEAAGLGLETAARELRWSWLRQLAEAESAAAVATGHTLDDHTETVLLRLGRGGGAGCLTPLARRQGLRWSPLLHARRGELRAYLRQRRIPWMDDASNDDPFTPRNRWRQLLEPMRQEAPALDRHLWETHLQVAELGALRDRCVQAWQGGRWQAPAGDGPLLLQGGDWLEPELRWVLEAGFRLRGWPREPELLRHLAAWLQPLLRRKSKKIKEWGGWSVAPAEPWADSPLADRPGESRLMLWALVKKSGP
jgi:tRNA(Ile)-lysidine synthetase-like protein